MSLPPSKDDWDTSNLQICRRAYLESGRSFSAIADAALIEAKVHKLWVEPYRNPPRDVNDARQVCFRVGVTKEVYDLLYNGPDGLRGRYWQSPDAGCFANRHLLDIFKPVLLKFGKENPTIEATPEVIEASLDGISAKVWIREKDDSGNWIISTNEGPQLRVLRWEQNEHEAGNPLWRSAPYGDEIEFKGALLDLKGVEHIPSGKRDRSCQIHRYGFT